MGISQARSGQGKTMYHSFITDEASQYPEEFLQLAGKHGVRSLEVRSVWGAHIGELPNGQRRELRRQLEGYGVTVCCLDSFAFKCDVEQPVDGELERLKRDIGIASELGAGIVRVFSFLRRGNPDQYTSRVRDALGEGGRIARDAGLLLGIENCRRTMHRTGEEMGSLLEQLDGDVFGVVWDPANAITSGADLRPLENGYHCMSGRILHVHVKNPSIMRGKEIGYTMLEEAHEGLEWPEQVRLLSGDKFAGALSLETHWRSGKRLGADDLARPGGYEFSRGGYEATDKDMLVLCRWIEQELAGPSV